MAETIVENRICQHCGAEVRDNTLFCYNCGKSVAPEIVEDLPERRSVSDSWFRENIVAEKEQAESNGDGQNQAITAEAATDQPIPKSSLIEETAMEETVAEETTVEEPPLKSAAAMRRKAKPVQPKKVEIIWEEYESAPNKWFIAAAVLLSILAVGILYLAKYLK